MRQRLVVVKQWLGWCLEQGHDLQFNPWQIKNVARPGRKPRIIAFGDFQRMLQQWDARTFEGRRNRVMAMLALDTGARVSEIVGMNVSDVATDRRRIHVLGKGSRERFLALSTSMAAEFDAWIAFRRDAYKETGLPDDGVLFPATWGRRRNGRTSTATDRLRAVPDRDRRMHPNVFTCVCRDACKRAGIDPPILPHALRRTWATNSLRKGTDVRMVQQAGGWESMTTMEHYLAEASDDDLLAATETSLIHGIPGVGGGRNRKLGKRRSKQDDG